MSIEIWEAKLLLKVRMERIPAEDFRCIDVDDVYSIVGFHGAIMIVLLTCKRYDIERGRRNVLPFSTYFRGTKISFN